MNIPSSLPASIIKMTNDEIRHFEDVIAVEEPLEIRMVFGDASHRVQKNISITMRTPGNDFELAAGFLFTEGIIKGVSDIQSMKHGDSLNENIIVVELHEHVQVQMNRLDRNFYTTSSCGVCGKSSIDAVKTVCRLPPSDDKSIKFFSSIICQLPEVLRNTQSVFDATGGLHGCGLFNDKGELLLSKEDVGRHNALDKLIGASLQQSLFPLHKYLLLLSGRASFELVQKAWMAGIKCIAAIGAPSSLAVQMAEESSITLIGFLRNKSFNIYSGSQRIINVYENSYQG